MPAFNHVRDSLGNTFVLPLSGSITGVKTLASRLKFARELRNLSQEELAARAKCAQSTIGNVENESRKSLRNLVEVARVLQVSCDWLYDGKGPAPTAHNPYRVAEPAATYTATRDTWPFRISRAEFDALPSTAQAEIDAFMMGIVSRPRKAKLSH